MLEQVTLKDVINDKNIRMVELVLKLSELSVKITEYHTVSVDYPKVGASSLKLRKLNTLTLTVSEEECTKVIEYAKDNAPNETMLISYLNSVDISVVSEIDYDDQDEIIVEYNKMTTEEDPYKIVEECLKDMFNDYEACLNYDEDVYDEIAVLTSAFSLTEEEFGELETEDIDG